MQRNNKRTSTEAVTTTTTTSIYDDYFKYTQQYQSQYGENTIVLMQVGAFFEIYGVKNAKTGEISGSHIQELSDICQLNISEKNATYKTADNNIVMAGFRDFTVDKYLLKLTDAGYTVPVFIQEKEGKTVTRKLDRIYSVGTYLSCETESSPNISNNFMCIWMETYKPYSRTFPPTRDSIVIGVSIINVFTGKSSIFQYETAFFMNTTTFDELERLVSVYVPGEVIIVSPFQNQDVNTIIQFIGVKTTAIHSFSTEKNPKTVNCSNQKYIREILSFFFGEESFDVCTEFNTQIIATQSFCFLLNYIKEQNSDVVRKIALPEFENVGNRMILANHTLTQLNIIDDAVTESKKHGKVSSVLSLLNRCCSPMGRRRFQFQLTNPTFDIEWLENEYKMTRAVLHSSRVENIEPLRKKIGKIRDIDKLCRQLVIRKIYPSSIHHLYVAAIVIREMTQMLNTEPELCDYLCADFLTDKNMLPSNLVIENNCSLLIDFFVSNFQLDACRLTNSMTSFEENIIARGVSQELDIALETAKKSQETFDAIRSFFNNIIQKYENTETAVDYVKIHETEKSGMSLQITSRRSQILKTILEKQYPERIELGGVIITKDIRFTKCSASNVEIEFPLLTDICSKLQTSKENIQGIIAKIYVELLAKLENNYLEILENISSFVSKLDVLICKGFIAKEYNYCSPEIETDAEKSFVDAKELRHCLIEHIQKNEIYVTNDVILGNSGNVLLYGTNAVGKTSLIRALGISVVMAQAGLFVPCSKFIYKPYTALFSRILGNDNLFKGLSTFAVEMSELRVILKMADENSLILGDELCSGTEMESALSIFVAGLIKLNEKRSSFIFATHFHEITEYDEIKEMENTLKMKHLDVRYDRERDCLVYDRKLKDGSGPRTYGLEVCKSLYLEEDFLSLAYSIRNKYNKETRGELSFAADKSYNSLKIRGKCEICNERMGEEIHHLQQQREANGDGFIGSFHKNHVANLMTVCEKCHDTIHDSKTDDTKKPKIRRKTTKGYVLETENNYTKK
jgi:DNA mismatch repair protein MutS